MSLEAECQHSVVFKRDWQAAGSAWCHRGPGVKLCARVTCGSFPNPRARPSMHCFGRSLRGAVRLRCAPAGLVSWQCRLVSRLCGVSPRPGHPSLPARVTATLIGICFPWKTLLREFWRAAQASSAQSFGTRTARNERRPAPPPHRLRLLEQLFPGDFGSG